MTVTLCNGKGGSGKTTLTILIASALVEAGHDVAVLDTDPQQTATRWISEVGSSGLKLATNGIKYSALLIDTPPRLDSPQVTDAIRRGDVIIVVTSSSPADLFTSRDTVALLKRENALGRSRLLFNQIQPATILSRDLDDLAERIGLLALKNKLHRRQAYQHAVLLGWKALSGEAREEILKVALEITALAA